MKSETLPQHVSERFLNIIIGLTAAAVLSAGVSGWMVFERHHHGFELFFHMACVSAVLGVSAFIRVKLRQAAAKEVDVEIKHRKSASGQLFDDKTVAGERQRTWLSFEKYGTLFTILIILTILGSGLFALFTHENPEIHTEEFTGALSYAGLLLAGTASFILIISGRTAGISCREEPVARTVAGFVLTLGYLLMMTVVIDGGIRFAAEHGFDAESSDIIFRNIGIVVLSLFIVDYVSGLIMSLYRGGESDAHGVNEFCESRITLILTGSGNILHALSDMITYQFGVQFSKAQISHLLYHYILPLTALEILIIMTVSTLMAVPDGELGFTSRFGVLTEKTYQSGIHFKWPWPIESVQLTPLGITETLYVGADPEMKNQLWRSYEYATDKQVGAALFQLTRYPNTDSTFSEDVIESTLSVVYTVHSPRDFYLNCTDAKKALIQLAQKTMIDHFITHDNTSLLAGKTDSLLPEMRLALQTACDRAMLGVEITQVAIAAIQPPSINAVSDAFRAKAESEINAETRLSLARGESGKIRANAAMECQRINSAAQLFAAERRSSAQSDALLFSVRTTQMNKMGTLYEQILTFDTFAQIYVNARKLFLAVQDQSVRNGIIMALDLKEQTGPTLLDAAVETP